VKVIKFFDLKIHCWGGLGSQLYALAVANSLKSKYKHRKISLVLHTSGVSKRLSELDFIKVLPFEIVQFNDFSDSSYSGIEVVNYNNSYVKLIIKKVLLFTRVICTGNTDYEFKKIKPWTLALRGHYSYRTIESSFYDYLLSNLNTKVYDSIINQTEITIHYRMGDLLKLTNKSIYPVEKIIEKVNEVTKHGKYSKIIVYSDSPNNAKVKLISAGLNLDFNVRDVGTIDVILECVSAGYFIGTNSKVSLWIVNIRRYLGRGDFCFLEGFDSRLYSPN
jgi:hypothetical protein